jgi:hypothetical protein
MRLEGTELSFAVNLTDFRCFEFHFESVHLRKSPSVLRQLDFRDNSSTYILCRKHNHTLRHNQTNAEHSIRSCASRTSCRKQSFRPRMRRSCAASLRLRRRARSRRSLSLSHKCSTLLLVDVEFIAKRKKNTHCSYLL